ncbi:mechanosensitive ion channel [Halioglobus maricola]|uniref:Small-conductance mechanosensitive channel n=2 Tax=Halioglobus maricola TaxID=2601894 RepID=A0A5P9NPR9_9GAMM|nr:mechanosensitive ion channel [Halioglobus maricola]
MLYLQSEALVGRIEYVGAVLGELSQRIAKDPSNADLGAARMDMARQQELDLSHLEQLIDLLVRMGDEPDAYKEVLLAQGQGIKVSALESGVLLSLLKSGWASVKESLTDNAPDILFRIFLFILVMVVFRYLSRLTKSAVKAACDRPGNDMSTLLKDVMVSVCGGTVLVLGFLIALSQIGISLGPMLAGLGVAGFVVGFALQDTLGNFAAGGMILLYRPYDVDDFVEVAGASGLVKKMSLVSTTITTFDNQTLVVPNSKIWGDVIKNVTAQKVRRVDLVFGISYTDDIAKAEQVLAAVLEDHDMILEKPEAMVKLHELADSSVNFIVRPWVRTADYWDVYWDVTREVKMRFDREGISIPFPQTDVHLYPQQES